MFTFVLWVTNHCRVFLPCEVQINLPCVPSLDYFYFYCCTVCSAYELISLGTYSEQQSAYDIEQDKICYTVYFLSHLQVLGVTPFSPDDFRPCMFSASISALLSFYPWKCPSISQ